MLSLGLGALEKAGELAFVWDDYKNTRPSHRHSTFSSNNVLGKGKRKRKERKRHPLRHCGERYTFHVFLSSYRHPSISTQREDAKTNISLVVCLVLDVESQRTNSMGLQKFLVSENHYEDTMAFSEVVFWSGENLASLSGRAAPKWIKSRLSFFLRAGCQAAFCLLWEPSIARDGSSRCGTNITRVLGNFDPASTGSIVTGPQKRTAYAQQFLEQ